MTNPKRPQIKPSPVFFNFTQDKHSTGRLGILPPTNANQSSQLTQISVASNPDEG